MIVITDAPKEDVVELTQAEHDVYMSQYLQQYRHFFGTPPSFETWVRDKKNGFKTDSVISPYLENIKAKKDFSAKLKKGSYVNP